MREPHTQPHTLSFSAQWFHSRLLHSRRVVKKWRREGHPSTHTPALKTHQSCRGTWPTYLDLGRASPEAAEMCLPSGWKVSSKGHSYRWATALQPTYIWGEGAQVTAGNSNGYSWPSIKGLTRQAPAFDTEGPEWTCSHLVSVANLCFHYWHCGNPLSFLLPFLHFPLSLSLSNNPGCFLALCRSPLFKNQSSNLSMDSGLEEILECTLNWQTSVTHPFPGGKSFLFK